MALGNCSEKLKSNLLQGSLEIVMNSDLVQVKIWMQGVASRDRMDFQDCIGFGVVKANFSYENKLHTIPRCRALSTITFVGVGVVVIVVVVVADVVVVVDDLITGNR